MKQLLLSLLVCLNVCALQNSETASVEESTSFNVTPIDSPRSSTGGSVSAQQGSDLREQMDRMQADHEKKEKRSRCRVLTSFIGGITSFVTAIASVIYAIKGCQPKN